MPNHRILFPWIGHTDMRAMAVDLPSVQRRKVLEFVGSQPALRGSVGPYQCIFQQQSFDHVRLLSAFAERLNQ
jgi:hypothetical protein